MKVKQSYFYFVNAARYSLSDYLPENYLESRMIF